MSDLNSLNAAKTLQEEIERLDRVYELRKKLLYCSDQKRILLISINK